MLRNPVLSRWIKPLENRQALIFRCASLGLLSLAISSMSHADSTNDLTDKLNKLGYTTGAIVERVENYRVDGWNYLDDQHILIYAGPSRRFLITTLTRCPDLNWAERIGFTSTTSYLTKLDKLIVRDASGHAQNCPIEEIRSMHKTVSK